MVPYLIIAGIWYFIKWIIGEHNAVGFFYELSTLSFWGNHQGAWYVAMLIPLYLVFPFYFRWIEKGKRRAKTICVFSSLIVLSAYLSFKQERLFIHLCNVLSSYLIFVIGDYLGESLLEKRFPDREVVGFCSALFIAKYLITPLRTNIFVQMVANAALGILLVVVLTWLLAWIKWKVLHNVLTWFGVISLELYLTNIFLSQAYDYFNVGEYIHSEFVSYGLILAIGVVLSFTIHRVLARK